MNINLSNQIRTKSTEHESSVYESARTKKKFQVELER